MQHPRLIFIVGPTACGKTELALREAELRGASILSCDSLCVYRGMDIGTAKPTPAEQQRVSHYGMDLCEPDVPYSISEYIHYRDEVLEYHRREMKPLLVVGGSGFYLKSFFSPVMDELKLSPDLEREVETLRLQAGLDGLLKRLKAANPGDESFPGLDMKNPRRVEKALIRCLASGKSYSRLLREFSSQPEPLPDWNKEVWMVSRSRDTLQRRNEERVQAMLDAGLIDEVQMLRARGFEKNPSACRAIGYREVLEFLDGRLDEEAMREQIVIHTRQLMRKQRTWFRHQIPVDREITS